MNWRIIENNKKIEENETLKDNNFILRLDNSYEKEFNSFRKIMVHAGQIQEPNLELCSAEKCNDILNNPDDIADIASKYINFFKKQLPLWHDNYSELAQSVDDLTNALDNLIFSQLIFDSIPPHAVHNPINTDQLSTRYYIFQYIKKLFYSAIDKLFRMASRLVKIFYNPSKNDSDSKSVGSENITPASTNFQHINAFTQTDQNSKDGTLDNTEKAANNPTC